MFARKWPALLALTMLATGGIAAATPPRASRAEASIPFVNHGGIRDWRAAGSHGLYVQDVHRRWYYADLINPCMDLPYANAIGFETRGVDTLDRFGSVIVRGQRCQIVSLTPSAGPPAKAKKG